MILSDREIAERCRGEDPMIYPFSTAGKAPGRLSSGVSSYGYDAVLADEIYLFRPARCDRYTIAVDPKGFDRSILDRMTVTHSLGSGSYVVLPPHSFALGRTVETFKIPRDVMVVCVGKSTYARCGLIVNVTPLEPEWRGQVTLEFSNTTPYPCRLYVGEGIAQFLFHRTDRVCEFSYADGFAKYQDQRGVTVSRVD